MVYDVIIFSAHPDDAEVQMGGTIALLTGQGMRVLLVDLCDGEPSDFAEPGVRAAQAHRAAAHLGADRIFLDAQDRFIADTPDLRVTLARLIREHRPRLVFLDFGLTKDLPAEFPAEMARLMTAIVIQDAEAIVASFRRLGFVTKKGGSESLLVLGNGFIVSARATATRCCSPPDIRPGRCFTRSDSATLSSSSRARARASTRGRRAIRIGISTFSVASNSGSRW